MALAHDYRKVGTQLIYELIEESNPGFMNSVQVGTLSFGTPQVQSVPPGGIQNTNILVKGSPNSGTFGQKQVQYRRLDVSKILQGVTVQVKGWSAVSSISVARMRELLLAQYGINLTAADISGNPTFVQGIPTTVTIATGSLCYLGSINITWVMGKRQLSEIAGNKVLAGRNWPEAMIDFGDGSKPQGELMLYHLDYSQFKTDFAALSSGAIYGTGIVGIVDKLNVLSTPIGTTFTSGSVSTANGLNNCKITRYALPNAAVPEANSAQYGWCLVFEPQETAWFFGKLIAHYN